MIPPAEHKVMNAWYDGLFWHRLEVVTRGEQVTELSAAACEEGISIIARWELQKDGSWKVWAMDTERQCLEKLTDFGEEEVVPQTPPDYLLRIYSDTPGFLSTQESRVIDYLVSAWDDFLKLPTLHPDDAAEFRAAIHQAQRIVMARPVSKQLNDQP